MATLVRWEPFREVEVHVAKPEEPEPRRIQIGASGQKTVQGKSEKK